MMVDAEAPPVEAVPEVVRAPEPSLRDRWAAPFAVSSEGTVRPRQPREVVILDADPTIAAGIAEQRLVDLNPTPSSAVSARATGTNGAATDPRATPPIPSASDRVSVAAVDGPGDEETRQHRVGAGDTLTGIARRYGVSVDAIRTLNRLEDDRIRLGQLLRLPPAAN